MHIPSLYIIILQIRFAANVSVEHLAMIEKKIGKFPRRMLLKGRASSSPIASKCFDRMRGTHKMAAVLKEDSLHFVLTECENLKQELGEDAVTCGLYELLRTVLTIDPWFRPKAKKALALAKKVLDVEDD